MDPASVLPMLLPFLPAIFLAVTGLMVGVLVSGPLVNHVLPRFAGKKLSSNQAGAVRWCTSLGMALLCFMMAGQFGLGGGGRGKKENQGVVGGGKSQVDKEEVDAKTPAEPLGAAKPPKPVGLKMRILGPDLAREYSGSNHAPDNLFWFGEVYADKGGQEQQGKGGARTELVDWEKAKKKIQQWKGDQVPGKTTSIQFLYTTQDPDDSSPLLVEVSRWCREMGVTLDRQTTAEGLP
jgi:hypothetical protein